MNTRGLKRKYRIKKVKNMVYGIYGMVTNIYI